jgi:hypothetical protein
VKKNLGCFSERIRKHLEIVKHINQQMSQWPEAAGETILSQNLLLNVGNEGMIHKYPAW